ncbi:hypothetical protein N802_07110 [Knoellia sinensis KCTC 19936]|uniref:GDYXXLXY domain-containing protein n=1 Tax=Knoellia sinensis KCTC 19936 TaxID=1385520 RepID=A0A0A0J457_9MICO|nr:GDYXXLXY domain-containing protein [Knoellia sinensis]KGN30406.1 hypothetical protein N802_07110 [Knoellia sinensis KCTC 19936]
MTTLTATQTPSGPDTSRRRTLVLGVVVVQFLLVLVAVWSPLSARLTGDEVRLRVAPVDPIDPFRGAYVVLGYPDLPGQQQFATEAITEPTEAEEPVEIVPDEERGDGWVPLRREGDVWVGDTIQRTRPTSGLYLKCNDSDWQLRCGIENWFLPQNKAAGLERAVRDGETIATVRVDSRGNAALVGVELEKD